MLSRMAAITLVCGTLAACDEDSPIDPAEELPAANFQRILVADATAPTARLIALHNDSTIQTFTLAEPSSRVYRTGSARFGVIQQMTAGRVQFVDGGVWADNQTAHRHNASLMGFQLSDGRPSDENVMGDWVSMFFDGSGVIRWVRESELASASPRVALEVNSGRPHHGVSMTVLSGNTPFFAHSVANEAGAAAGVAVRNQQGQIVAEVRGSECPGTHGNSAIATGGVLGCSDGFVVVRGSGGTITAQKVTPTGDMAGLGLRNAYAGTGATFILGQFSALPGQPAQRVFATIDPATGATNRLPALPAGVTDHWRAVEPVKGQIVMLGTDGNVYVYSGSTRQLQHTVRGVVPALPASGALTHQLSVAEDLAAVANPSNGEVVLVNLSAGTVIRRVRVGGAPSRLAILGVTRAGTYTEQR